MCRPARLRFIARRALAATCFLALSGCGGTPPAPPAVPPPPAAPPAAASSTADAVPAPGAGTPAAAAPTTPPATPATPADEVRAALADARTLLEQKKYKDFLEGYAPIEALRQMRQNNALDAEATRFGDAPHRQTLVALLKYLETRTPEISEDGGIATFTVPEDWRNPAPAETGAEPAAPDEANPIPETRATAQAELSTESVSGYSGELASVLEQAAQALEADDIVAFIEHMFPIGEVRRLRGTEPYAEVVERLAENPDMKQRMIADLQAAAKATPVMDETGTVATITLPAAGKFALERTLRFEQVEGHWRLFNAAGPIRETVAAQLKNQPPVLPNQTREPDKREFQLERIGTQWRILEISHELMETAAAEQPQPVAESVEAEEVRP